MAMVTTAPPSTLLPHVYPMLHEGMMTTGTSRAFVVQGQPRPNLPECDVTVVYLRHQVRNVKYFDIENSIIFFISI